jgi:deoxyxylulose-5-phosphate synthase
VLEAAAASGKPITSSIVVLGGPKEFINHGSRNAQLMQAGINADKIVETVSAFGGLDVEAKRF